MLIIVGRSNRSQLRPESCRSGAAAAETSQRLLKDRDSQALRSSRSIFEGRYRSRCTRANTSRVRNDVVTIALLVEHRFPSPVPAPYGARCAVAFWGSGAVEQLFGSWLHEAAQIRRDIPMGATNPDELRNLGAPSNPCLKHLERLHGKVYISERGASLIGQCVSERATEAWNKRPTRGGAPACGPAPIGSASLARSARHRPRTAGQDRRRRIEHGWA